MRALLITTVVGAAVALSGCQSTGQNLGGVEYDKAALGTLIGAAAGYGVSKGINNGSSSQNNRAIAIGAILGGASGLYLDNKEKKLRQQLQGTGVDVNRNPDGSINMVMPSVTFATNSSTIQGQFQGALNDVAKVLREDGTANQLAIVVHGHTDNTGSDSVNNPLSQNRANSVKNYLSALPLCSMHFIRAVSRTRAKVLQVRKPNKYMTRFSFSPMRRPSNYRTMNSSRN